MRTAKNNHKFSFKLYRKLADESYTISLILRYNKKRYIHSLPLTVYSEQWDDARERYIDDSIAKEIIKEQNLKDAEKRSLLRSLHADAQVNNIFLDRKAIELRDIVDDFDRRKVPFTNEMIIDKLFTKVSSSKAETFLLAHIEKLNKEKRYNTATTFKDLHVCLKKFDKKFDRRSIPEIDYNYVNDYFNYFKDEGREVGGIGVNLRALRALLNEAIKNNIGSPETYPFSNQYGTRTGKDTFCLSGKVKTTTRKKFIPIQHLEKFYNQEFTSISHQRTKELFFFSFFCGGINFVDMAKLQKSDIKHGFDKEGNPIKYFIYIRSKTGERIEVQLNEDIQRQIDLLQNPIFGKPIENYLLPIYTQAGLDELAMNKFRINKLGRMNKYLKEMSIIMEFPEGLAGLSSYFARHSFAMRLFAKTKSIDIVSAGLHHSNTEITKVYLESFGKDEIAKVSCGLLD